ncbi:hypothetical protein LZ32DRAFT_680465 [Colletotrichum eremochloae]|nr:hypothetical protein LZ32DRAFT_680465 [Colletotrichum eremochloae]
MSSPGSSNESLTDLIRDALVGVYNSSPAGWHEFECAALGALAQMSNEVAKATAAMEEDVDMPDADDDDDNDDVDGDDNGEDDDDGDDHDEGDDDGDGGSAPGSSGSGGAGQRGRGGGRGGRGGHGGRGGRGGRGGSNSVYHCPFAGCGKSYTAVWTRTRHIKLKHPNQPVPPFNDPPRGSG